MKIQSVLAVAGSLVLSCASLAAQQVSSVTVHMNDAQGDSVGTAVLTPAANGVNVQLDLRHLPPGEHAIHVHTFASCEVPADTANQNGPAFGSAGGHFNPDRKQHGLQNPEGPHAGDMPNFKVAPDGTTKTTLLAPGVTMGDDSHSVFSNGGTALVIDDKPDNMKSESPSSAFDRIACGVITKP
jgi:Cu-Zn family superoxide dismutase